MRICRIKLEDGSIVLAALDDQDRVTPLVREGFHLREWAELPAGPGPGPGLAAAVQALAAANSPIASLSELEAAGRLLAPLDRQEVWAAGVTYWRSRQARMEESSAAATLYDLIYEAERPELFFKATPHRVAGPGDYIGIRADSAWNVPEPELAVLLSPQLEPIGLTVCNDVSSRDIEGANPLYLPQAKIYNHSCALGPAVLLLEDGRLPDKPDLRIECSILREGVEVFQGGASAAQLRRTLPELVNYLGRHNSFPGGVFLSTGTCIVPPDHFTLQAGDLVEIVIERIGRLRNPVMLLD